ncbi:MAG TPA: DUF4870 domain-containing protein [Caldilineae bacterium]|nr:DUF4870 domain-containing protein [Caldilineae bacterium]
MEEKRNLNASESEESRDEKEMMEAGATPEAEQVEESPEVQGATEASEPEEPQAKGEEAPTREEGEPAVTEPAPPSGPKVVTGEIDLEASDDDRLMAALAWLGLVILQIPLVSLVLLIAEENKRRPFQRFHAINSILFWVAGFVYEIIAIIVYLVLTLITLGCLGLFLWVIFFLPHVVGLYYAYQAYQGKRSEIPFITEFARSQGWL